MVLRLDSPTEWDEWFFTTPERGSVENDPVRFMLEGSIDGREWETVGSSMSALVNSQPVHLHGVFPTGFDRGRQHSFRVLQPTFFGHYAIMALGDLQNTAILLCGISGRERLGAAVPNVQAFLFALSQLVAAWQAPLRGGDYSRLVYLYLAAMQASRAARIIPPRRIPRGPRRLRSPTRKARFRPGRQGPPPD